MAKQQHQLLQQRVEQGHSMGTGCGNGRWSCLL